MFASSGNENVSTMSPLRAAAVAACIGVLDDNASGTSMHSIATLSTFALTVPAPFATVQSWRGADGCVRTVTAYDVPLATPDMNVIGPFAFTVTSAPPLTCNTKGFVSPLTVPLTEYVAAGGVGDAGDGGFDPPPPPPPPHAAIEDRKSVV